MGDTRGAGWRAASGGGSRELRERGPWSGGREIPISTPLWAVPELPNPGRAEPSACVGARQSRPPRLRASRPVAAPPRFSVSLRTTGLTEPAPPRGAQPGDSRAALPRAPSTAGCGRIRCRAVLPCHRGRRPWSECQPRVGHLSQRRGGAGASPGLRPRAPTVREAASCAPTGAPVYTSLASAPWGLRLCSLREGRDTVATLSPRPPPSSPRR